MGGREIGPYFFQKANNVAALEVVIVTDFFATEGRDEATVSPAGSLDEDGFR
jgi:hypothetical protein